MALGRLRANVVDGLENIRKRGKMAWAGKSRLQKEMEVLIKTMTRSALFSNAMAVR